MMKILKLMSLFIGSSLLFLAVVSFVDPEFARYANDSDPFGGLVSATRMHCVLLSFIGLFLLIWPVFLFKKNKSYKSESMY